MLKAPKLCKIQFSYGYLHTKVDNAILLPWFFVFDNVEHILVGRYQIRVLELLAESVHGKNMNSSQHMKESMKCQFVEIHSPNGVDLRKDTEYASQAAMWGIEVGINRCLSCFLYPIQKRQYKFYFRVFIT